MKAYSEKAKEILDTLHTERLAYETEYIPLMDCVTQCAAYEETEMEPETVAQLKKIAEIFNCNPTDPAQLKSLYVKLQELALAERAGRLVVLPCKVGDTVYQVYHPQKCTPVITERKIETLEEAAYLVGRMGKRFLIDIYLTRPEAEAAVKLLTSSNQKETET